MDAIIPFAVGDLQARSKQTSSALLTNAYAEPNPEGSKYPYTIYATPGSVEWLDFDVDAPVFGMHVTGEQLYVVVGSNVYLVSNNGTKTLLGNIGANNALVYMGDTRTETGVLKSDGTLWVISGTTVTQVTDADYQLSSSMTTADGYTILTVQNSDQWFISGQYNMTTYDATEFATAEEKSDTLVRAEFFNSSVWLFGQSSFEVWANVGATEFPYEPVPGTAKTTRGCLAGRSVTQEDNTLFWLGDDKIIYRATAFDPLRISTFAIEEKIRKLTNPSDAFSFCYTQAGHKFLVMTFPTDGLTIVYDMTTQFWHIRETYGLNGRWYPNCHTEFAGLQLVGDSQSGKIFYLDLDTFQEGDLPLVSRIQTQPVWDKDNRLIHDRIFLDIDPGVGLTTGQGSDPIVWMRYSDDGSNNWSDEEFAYIGKIGEYSNRVVYYQQGQSRKRIYEFVISDPVRRNISGAYGWLRQGKS